MNDADCFHALNVALCGDYTKITRYRTHGTWRNAWDAYGKDHARTDNPARAYTELTARGITLILQDDPLFPPLLREIPHPPHGLYIKGSLPDHTLPSVAIVGTRKASGEGKALARYFAEELARAGIVVVSGLAFGIDAAAHEGALAAKGATVAVLAHGLERVYPRSHEQLAGKILAGERGALISEYAPGIPTYPSHFLLRNRIVSGVSRGIILIETPERSGSLATARFALEQNRDVFVVPGSARHPNYKGSHELIRAGAELVTEPRHVLQALGLSNTHESPSAAHADLNEEEQTIVRVLAHAASPLSVDKISELTNLNAKTVNLALTFLILKHEIAETERGYTTT